MNNKYITLKNAYAIVGAAVLILGCWCGWQNHSNKTPAKPPHYVLIEETYSHSVMHIYKAKVLEELDGCYKIKIIDFYYKCIQPDEIWILKSGEDSGEFHLIWDSEERPYMYFISTGTITNCKTFTDNGGTLPTSHGYRTGTNHEKV